MQDRWAKANGELLEQIRAGGGGRAEHGGRDWENWSRWGTARIERIVQDEQKQAPAASARRRLAQLLAGLGGSLLDVGCGPGALWPRLAECRPGVWWAGADVTAEMVAVAHRLFPAVPVMRADGGSLPFASRSFDVVLLRHVLEHLPGWLMEATLGEAARVARRVVVVAFYVKPLVGGVPRSRRVGDGFLETQWTREAVERPIAGRGWRVRERVLMGDDDVWICEPA
jgi:SAM-dependent methyltransferase